MITRQFSLDAWVLYFEQAQLPVLRRTQEELPRLEEREDELNGQDITAVILRDPIMTVKVLRYLQEHRSKRQITDITTISRAVMMIGTTPFFKAFASQPLIEEHLSEYPQALEGAMRVMSRAYHASLYALDWAVQHHDMDTDEVVVAALLRDLAELLLWCFAPEPMLAIREKMRLNPALRSAAAQQEVLGFRIIELQLALIQAWQLPGLLQSLMDEAHADHPRTKCVALATALARHSANGWNDAALPDDFSGIADFLKKSPDDTWDRIRHTTLIAAKSWEWYGVPPAAAWLPMQTAIPQEKSL